MKNWTFLLLLFPILAVAHLESAADELADNLDVGDGFFYCMKQSDSACYGQRRNSICRDLNAVHRLYCVSEGDEDATGRVSCTCR